MPNQVGSELPFQKSHDATVRVYSQVGNSSGSGVLIAPKTVLTCFHVVAAVSQNGIHITFQCFPDLQVMLSTGEVIAGRMISIPSNDDSSPHQYDFAIVELAHPPVNSVPSLVFAVGNGGIKIGDEVVFSGYPLATRGMVTHRGIVSGGDLGGEWIFVQASINKGNSGGSLLNERGEIIGIISEREGTVGPALEALRAHNNTLAASGNRVIRMGVDSNAAMNALIDTLDQYISTGIGYARSIKFVRSYLDRYPGLMM